MASKIITKFFGGMVRDEKSKQLGVCSNIEEFDILENQDYMIPTLIMESDSMPGSTDVKTYTADRSDTVFGYGRETAGSKVRIVSVATGGATAPGAFSTLFTAASVLYYSGAPIEYHSSATGDANRLYWLSKNGSTISLNHCTTAGASETSDGTLTGLDGTNDRLGMRRIYGELHIMNGQYIARVDKDGVFTEKAFTLPNGWEAVDICEAGNSGLIIARNININSNITKGYFWDLTSLNGFDDSFDIPFGGPQWVIKHRETIKIMCAINNRARFYQVSAYAGGVPSQIKGIELLNVATETSGVPISSPMSASIKDDIIYFGINKSDKTGIFALGQIDNDKNYSFYLAKRFATSSYALHVMSGLFIQGPNFYGAFVDNGTVSNSRCMTLNSATRSSNAVYETVVIDEDLPAMLKRLSEVFITSQPAPTSCSATVSVLSDYGSYSQIYKANGTSMVVTDTLASFSPKKSGIKSFKIKLSATSSGTNAIRFTGVGWTTGEQSTPSKK